MAEGSVSIQDVIATLPGPWQPRDLVTANDTVVRVALFHGDFPWHVHDEDELFLCWDGSFRIEVADREPVTLHPGELFVVPRHTRHRPVAESPAHGIMIERPETKQYGNDELAATSTRPTLDEVLERAGGHTGGSVPLASAVASLRDHRGRR